MAYTFTSEHATSLSTPTPPGKLFLQFFDDGSSLAVFHPHPHPSSSSSTPPSTTTTTAQEEEERTLLYLSPSPSQGVLVVERRRSKILFLSPCLPLTFLPLGREIFLFHLQEGEGGGRGDADLDLGNTTTTTTAYSEVYYENFLLLLPPLINLDEEEEQKEEEEGATSTSTSNGFEENQKRRRRRSTIPKTDVRGDDDDDHLDEGRGEDFGEEEEEEEEEGEEEVSIILRTSLPLTNVHWPLPLPLSMGDCSDDKEVDKDSPPPPSLPWNISSQEKVECTSFSTTSHPSKTRRRSRMILPLASLRLERHFHLFRVRFPLPIISPPSIPTRSTIPTKFPHKFHMITRTFQVTLPPKEWICSLLLLFLERRRVRKEWGVVGEEEGEEEEIVRGLEGRLREWCREGKMTFSTFSTSPLEGESSSTPLSLFQDYLLSLFPSPPSTVIPSSSPTSIFLSQTYLSTPLLPPPPLDLLSPSHPHTSTFKPDWTFPLNGGPAIPTSLQKPVRVLRNHFGTFRVLLKDLDVLIQLEMWDGSFMKVSSDFLFWSIFPFGGEGGEEMYKVGGDTLPFYQNHYLNDKSPGGVKYDIEGILGVCLSLYQNVHSWLGRRASWTRHELSPHHTIMHSSKVRRAVTVEGVGRFTIYEDGRVRGHFDSRVILEIPPASAFTSSDVEDRIVKVLDDGRGVGGGMVRLVEPIGFEGEVDALIQFMRWESGGGGGGTSSSTSGTVDKKGGKGMGRERVEEQRERSLNFLSVLEELSKL